jgi:hypothetical protein
VIGVGKVIPNEAGAAEGAVGLVMIGYVMPSELGTVENEAGHEAARVGCLMGHVWVFCLVGGRGATFGGVGEVVRSGVWAGVGGVGDGACETQVSICDVDGEGCGCGQVVTWGVSSAHCGVGQCNGVLGVMGVEGTRGPREVGVEGTGGPSGVTGGRPSVSASSSTQTRLLMVLRIFSTLIVVGGVDTSFKVDPRCLREHNAIVDSRLGRSCELSPGGIPMDGGDKRKRKDDQVLYACRRCKSMHEHLSFQVTNIP